MKKDSPIRDLYLSSPENRSNALTNLSTNPQRSAEAKATIKQKFAKHNKKKKKHMRKGG